MEQGTFGNWIRAGMTQFYKLGKNRRMYPESEFTGSIFPPSTSRAAYHLQYLQVQSLISQLMCTGNVCRRLTAFEMLTTGDRAKILSKICDMLLSIKEPEDKAKPQWEYAIWTPNRKR